MEALFQLANTGPVTLIIVTIVLVVLHRAGVLEVMLAFVGKKDKTDTDRVLGYSDTEEERSLGVKMDTLMSYYNHDTTALLTDIRDEMRKLNQRHDNYEVIGIKTRDCAK